MKLLFITATRIGDAVLSTGLLDHLLAQHPGARVTVAAGAAAVPLFAAVPGLDRLIAIRKQRFAGHWWRLWRSVAAQRWDLVVDLRGSALAMLLWTRRRRVWVAGKDAGHRVQQLARVLDLADPPPPRLWIGEANRAAASRLLPEGPPVLALGPAANWPGKQWPAERFVALAQALTGPGGALAGARVAVFAAPAERATAAPVIAGLPGAVDAVDTGDLLTVAAALARCRLYVGNDSGLMHLAAATGLPTLGLFGPSPERLYAPWGPHAAVVRTRIDYPEHFEMLKRDPAVQPHLMDTLETDRAIAAAEALLARTAWPTY